MKSSGPHLVPPAGRDLRARGRVEECRRGRPRPSCHPGRFPEKTWMIWGTPIGKLHIRIQTNNMGIIWGVIFNWDFSWEM